MESNKNMGLLSIILGLIFIIFPMISEAVISIIIGLSLLFFGISAVYTGWDMKKYANNMYAFPLIVIGIIVIILGFLFVFYIDALSFLVSIQFYLIGFILIILGIIGFLSRISGFSMFSSILIFVMGIISIALAAFAWAQPIYIAIIIGIILVIEGIALLFSD
ncbi:DUF308 domain-containing protein [uncultured Methanobrevibacter sp.]|uniref:DUF308 domain-containing protein n=1 Tax=uncultured Methanobrevibacter sp. TaxID=253161 RepID=UPI0025EE0AC9|nr:DUF308 domain-containing protein [uncultured Methanobrevibacter sp.]